MGDYREVPDELIEKLLKALLEKDASPFAPPKPKREHGIVHKVIQS